MMNILQKIIETKRIEVEMLDKMELFRIASSIDRPTLSFSRALINSPSGVIAEFKRRSPSKGTINSEVRVEDVVRGYQAAGVAAVSVLTDMDYFGGSADDLIAARKVVDLPLLRKDFIIDRSQICQARIWGADAILLIAAVLSVEETAQLAHFARALSMEVLLEIHSEHELGHINKWVNVVGVNNRDLTTFTTSVDRSIELNSKIPNSLVKISESGISDVETLRMLRRIGFRGFLMGENFMKHSDPAREAAEFIEKIGIW